MDLEHVGPKPIRVGVIGPGQIANERLVPALRGLPGAIFWSVLGRDLAKATEFAKTHKAAAPNAVHTDLHAFLADPELDAVIIATPDKLHAAQAIAAASAGKHVFVEKPMATSSHEAAQILHAVRTSGVKSAVGYHLRFHAGHAELRNALQAGAIGKLRHMRVCWTLKADPSDWRASAETGQWWSLGATGTHAIDLVRWFMQPTEGPIVEVKSVLSNTEFGGPHDETAVVLLRFASGATAEVISSVLFRAPRVVEVFGSSGSAICTGTLGPRGTGDVVLNDKPLVFSPVDPYAAELQNFLDSIRGGADCAIDGLEGAMNVSLLEQAVACQPEASPMSKTSQTSFEKVEYRGKHFTLPLLTSRGGVRFRPNARANQAPIPTDSPVIQDLNKPFDLQRFKVPRRPVSLGFLTPAELAVLSTDNPAPRVLDMPIKFPGSDVRIPKELAMYAPIIKRAFAFEAAVNPDCYDEYYCYLTIDKGFVKPGTLQREAPCHVDGFQGARWNPKVRNNHTYTVSNAVPTAYYVQPFDFDALDDTKHDFFWEMNRQVALTNSRHAWQPGDGEMTMMDCYCVHRGTEATEELFRTFVRISFEARIFDRLGNAHNPMFKYAWPMVPRDIEEVNLVAFDPTSDPSLRVFPHQNIEGKPRDKGAPKTKPNLKPLG